MVGNVVLVAKAQLLSRGNQGLERNKVKAPSSHRGGDSKGGCISVDVVDNFLCDAKHDIELTDIKGMPKDPLDFDPLFLDSYGEYRLSFLGKDEGRMR